jgi:outer membrane protein assembly factor BamB
MTLNRFFLPLALTVVTVLVGCGSSKPKPASLVDFKPSLSAKVAWTAKVGDTPEFKVGVGQFSPGVSGDSVIAASEDGEVSRVNLQSGKVDWRVDLDTRIIAGVAVGNGSSSGFSAVVTDRNQIVVLDAAGKVSREINLGGVVLEIPVIAGDIVVARLTDNRVAGWDISSGERRWVFQRTLPPLVLHGQSGLRGAAYAPEESSSSGLGANDVVVNLPGGRLLWVNALTGAVRWEAQVATPTGSNEVERLVDLLGAPVVQGDHVCVSAYQTAVSCFGVEDGKRQWIKNLSAGTTVGADARFVFVADQQSRLHALARATGETSWTSDALRLRGLNQPISVGRALWVADQFGFLHALDRESGQTLARVKLDGGAVSGAMRATSAGLLVQTQGGRLMLIRTEG